MRGKDNLTNKVNTKGGVGETNCKSTIERILGGCLPGEGVKEKRRKKIVYSTKMKTRLDSFPG